MKKKRKKFLVKRFNRKKNRNKITMETKQEVAEI